MDMCSWSSFCSSFGYTIVLKSGQIIRELTEISMEAESGHILPGKFIHMLIQTVPPPQLFVIINPIALLWLSSSIRLVKELGEQSLLHFGGVFSTLSGKVRWFGVKF